MDTITFITPHNVLEIYVHIYMQTLNIISFKSPDKYFFHTCICNVYEKKMMTISLQKEGYDQKSSFQ